MSVCDTTVCALITSILALLIAVVYWYISRIYGYFDKKGIPGPKPLFPLGTWTKTARKFLGNEDVLNSEKYGPSYGSFDGLQPNFITTDVEIIKKVLVTEASKSIKDRRAALTKNPSLKRVLRILSDENQNDVNIFLNSTLKGDKFGKLLTRLDMTTNALVRNIIKEKNDENNVLINPLVSEFTADTVAMVLLGIDLNADPVLRQGFVKQMRRIFAATNTTSPLALIPLLYGQGDSWVLPKTTMDFFKGLIANTVKNRVQEEVAVESKAADLVDLLLEASFEEKKLMAKEKAQDDCPADPLEGILLTKEVIEDQILAAILVIRHWVKVTLIAAIRALSRNKEVQNKLKAEINSAKFLEKSSLDSLESLKYLEMVVLEVLRLHPTEFRIERIVEQSVKIQDDLILEEGRLISIPLFPLHRSTEFYSEPNAFKPERFQNISALNPFAFLPFGQAGVRANLAFHIGMIAIKLAIVKITSKLNLTALEREEEDMFEDGLTGVPLPAPVVVVLE